MAVWYKFYIFILYQNSNKMDKWKITIKAKNEDEVVTYLKCLLNSFKAAVLLNQPLDHMFASDMDGKSKIICKKK